MIDSDSLLVSLRRLYICIRTRIDADCQYLGVSTVQTMITAGPILINTLSIIESLQLPRDRRNPTSHACRRLKEVVSNRSIGGDPDSTYSVDWQL